ncbi:hypothetical protein [Heyndrickxia coagulans]|uniref:hypothetical protein n=1 Tax=Heyndrickxia coagulans TaxID=1398 RepID=UPI0014525241|nr:hypothetical protein [Heyndrickxia coagulans]MED4495581.1 hypothetical protein [Heyndrickxia coagulans]MED4534990.1 hypothetical protein [Heyndrickxia coagulans]QJE31819.1 hypothetical protein HHU11_03640 [Heyndrickxia coagulans]
MIELVSTNISAVQDEMRRETKLLKEKIKAIKAEAKRRNKQKNRRLSDLTIDETRRIESIEAEIRFYNPSKVLPAKVGAVIINYKFYLKFMKKIAGFEAAEIISKDGVLIKYRSGKAEGSLLLADLTPYYKDFFSVPVGKRVE